MHNHVVRTLLCIVAVIVQYKFLAAVGAASVLATSGPAAGHFIGAQPRRQVCASSSSGGLSVGLAVSRNLPSFPEVFGEQRSEDRYVYCNNTNDGLAHAPSVDVGTTRISSQCKDYPDDSCSNDEETGANKQTDDEFPVR